MDDKAEPFRESDVLFNFDSKTLNKEACEKLWAMYA